MKGLKTLVFMQLKDKIDFSFLKSKKQTIFKVVLSILKFVIITALIYAGFTVLSFLRLVSLLPGIPQNFLTIVFTVMFILSIVVCTFGLMKNLYFTKDNALLLTLPANRTVVFTSKLIVYYIYELIRNLTYILPLFVAYGIIDKLPFYFYPWLVVAFVIITAMPVAIGALLSIPTMFISNFIKQYKWLEYSLLIIVIGGTITGLVFLTNAIPANFDLIGTWGTTFWKIQSFMDGFVKIFAPFAWVVTAVIGERYGISNNMFIGKQWLCLLGLLATIVAVFGITYLLVRPLFFRMASTPFEYRKVRVTRHFKNKKKGTFKSAVDKDLILNYRTPEKFYNLLVVVAGLPILILLLNKIYAAMDTRLAGANMAVAFNILMILLIALSSNISLAHIYSEEGASSYLLKTAPKSYLKTLSLKLFVNIVLVSISIIITTAIFVSFVGYTVWQGILIFLILEMVYLGHTLWSAELDIMNPQTAQYQMTGSHVNNPNDIKSTLSAFLLSAVFAFLTFFFVGENVHVVWYKILAFATLFLAARIWLYISKINVYYKEK